MAAIPDQLDRAGVKLDTLRPVPGDHAPAQLHLRVDIGVDAPLLVVEDVDKFEIVFEARISFDEPEPENQVGGVSTLSEVDLAASKLLANVDRWADAGVYSRDVIDLAMLELSKKGWTQAFGKAGSAYGEVVKRDVLKAVEMLQSRPDRLGACVDALDVDRPQAWMLDRLKCLARRC